MPEEGERGGSGDEDHERGREARDSVVGRHDLGAVGELDEPQTAAVNGMADRATSPAGTGQPRDGLRPRRVREVGVG
jgi:hypothetical protein